MPGEARGMRILLLGTCVISTCVSVRIERRLGGEGRPPRTRCSHGLSRCGYGAIRAAGPAEGFSECGILIRKRTEGVGAAWLTCEGGGSASPASAVASSAITSPIASSTVAHGRKHLWRRLGHRCRVNVSVRGTAAVAAAASAATAAASRRRPRPWSIRTRLWSVSTSRGLVATWQCQVDFLIVVPPVVVVVVVVVVVLVILPLLLLRAFSIPTLRRHRHLVVGVLRRVEHLHEVPLLCLLLVPRLSCSDRAGVAAARLGVELVREAAQGEAAE